MEQIDVEDYHTAVRAHISAVGGMFDMVFRKQAKDLGIGQTASPKEIDELTDRTANAMEFFVGPKMKVTIRRVMRSELKKRAPEYFNKKYGIV